MTPPNATPTRADVLREFKRTIKYGECSCASCMSGLLAEEVARLREEVEARKAGENAVAAIVTRLRAERAALIRRVEALKPGDWITREDLLAALREGGDDGR